MGAVKPQLVPGEVERHLMAVADSAETEAEREHGRRVAREAMSTVVALFQRSENFRFHMGAKYRRKSERCSPNQGVLEAILSYLASGGATSSATATSENESAETTEPSAEPTAEPAEEAASDDEQRANDAEKKRRRQREKKRRELDLSAFPRVIEDRHPSLEERTCACCGKPRPYIDCDKREHLEHIPGTTYVREERLHKYGDCCLDQGVTTAEGTPKPIPGSPVASSMLARIVVDKLLDFTPLYRQSARDRRNGTTIGDKVLGDWYRQAADLLQQVPGYAKKRLLEAELISFDDTFLRALNRNHPKNIQTGRLWLYLGDYDQIAYCEFTKDWKGTHPLRVLEGYKNNTQHDGYAGVRRLYRSLDPPRQFGCMDHARRRFVLALERGDERAAPVVALFGRLYHVESIATELGYGPAQRLVLRQERAVAIWDALNAAIESLAPGCTPASPLGRAATYWRNQRPTLRAYLSDGHVPISNVHVERLLRLVGLLRKNSLFVGSLEAGNRYATLLTLTLNCVLCGANPYDYFRSAFDLIASRQVTGDRLVELLPQNWLARQKSQQREPGTRYVLSPLGTHPPSCPMI